MQLIVISFNDSRFFAVFIWQDNNLHMFEAGLLKFILVSKVMQFILDVVNLQAYFFRVSLFISLCKMCPYSELFRSAFFPHFPPFGLNMDEYFSVFILNAQNAEKMRNSITPTMNTFYAVLHSFEIFIHETYS